MQIVCSFLPSMYMYQNSARDPLIEYMNDSDIPKDVNFVLFAFIVYFLMK